MSHPLPAALGPTDASACFRLRVHLGARRLSLARPLDRSTAHLLHDGISTLLLTDGDAWVVDTSLVTSCDRVDRPGRAAGRGWEPPSWQGATSGGRT